jgi:rSAM/selenodomain-associated transferase 2
MVSVIIPTLNEVGIIESSLKDLLSHSGDFEVIVADGDSSDGTLDLISQFPEVKLVASLRGRGKQMNAGAKVASGDIFLFLHADTSLPPHAFSTIEETMSQARVVGGCFYLSFGRRSPLLSLYSLFSRINHILFTYGDQGLFLDSKTFWALGGFGDIPIMEDVEIQRRLRRMGRFVKIAEPTVTSARRYIKYGIMRQQILNALLVFLYHLGFSPHLLKRFYS